MLYTQSTPQLLQRFIIPEFSIIDTLFNSKWRFFEASVNGGFFIACSLRFQPVFSSYPQHRQVH